MNVGDKVKIKKDQIPAMENIGLYRNTVYTIKGLIMDASGYGGVYAIDIGIPNRTFPAYGFDVVKTKPKAGFVIY